MRRSTDLVHWELLGPAIVDEPLWWADVRTGAGHVWAPHVVASPDGWRLYYAVSTFGSQRSAIGLATSPTLDPDAPGYGWTDGGIVVESFPGDATNAIDAAVADDDDGSWLLWGSYWDGIVAARLDPATGRLADPAAPPVPLARRPPPSGVIEAAFVVRHRGAWWLFTSFDQCCRPDATYHVRVGRSSSLLGPYVDADGVPLLEGGGTVVVAGHGEDVRGPGHQALLDADGELLLAHHWYDATAGGARTLGISAVAWLDGWPVLAPPGESATDVPPDPADLVGTWQVDRHRRFSPITREISLRPDGVVAGGGRWSLDGATVQVEVPVLGCSGPTVSTRFVATSGGSLTGRWADGWTAWATRTGPPGPDPCAEPAPSTTTTTTSTTSPADPSPAPTTSTSAAPDPGDRVAPVTATAPAATPVLAAPRLAG